MLSQPQETLELQQKQSKAVAVTSLSFPAGDVNNFIVGSEEGAVYTACRHGSRAGVLDVFEGHQVQSSPFRPHFLISCRLLTGQKKARPASMSALIN